MKNELNDLSGSEWLYFTNTVWETNYPPDLSHNLRKLHGAMKPPEAMRDLVLFFTKAGEFVLDPFAGVGGTLLGAELAGRKSLGFELNPKWVEIYQTIKERFGIWKGKLVLLGDNIQNSKSRIQNITARMMRGDCLQLIKTVKSESVDAIICDPPYGVGHKVTGFKDETNFAMFSTDDPRDFGNAPTTEEFLAKMKQLAREAFRALKPGRYMVILVGDRFQNGEFVPLGANLANALRTEGFQLKGIKIWFNRATQRPLKPYALKCSFVPNITHQNILILKRPNIKSQG